MEKKGRINKSFLDLYNLVQEADRDEFGYADLNNTQVHIYNGKQQVNLLSGNKLPTKVILFKSCEGIVKIFNCINGITDYNNPYAVRKIEDNITEPVILNLF